jgi:hypothetical protein
MSGQSNQKKLNGYSTATSFQNSNFCTAARFVSSPRRSYWAVVEGEE